MHSQWIFQWTLLIFSPCFTQCWDPPAKFTKVDLWAKRGFQYVKMTLCRRVSFLMESECEKFSKVHPSGVAVYLSRPASDQVLTILPDTHPGGLHSVQHGPRLLFPVAGGPRRPQRFSPGSSAHDAVLVLDPSPEETFGHPLVLFHLDFNVTRRKCSHMGGLLLGQDCLSWALKSRCQNQLKRRQWPSERPGATAHMHEEAAAHSVKAERARRHCEVHFLPLVVGVRDSNRTQRLHCVDHPDFARCPRPLPLFVPGELVSSCEFSRNTRRCHENALATHLTCRLYQTCDHAVLLSGGWRQQITYQSHVSNLQTFYHMLRKNGFQKNHIKIFFAGSGQVLETETEEVYPATEKEAIRKHISFICRRQHCADSLVLYFNSPTLSDGTMLLWDANNNGVADPKECYSVNELLVDLAGCRAKRVLLFVEQSYSAAVHKRLSGSLKHRNVVLFTSAPWTGTADLWGSLHPTECLIDHLNQAPAMVYHGGHVAELLNVTLAGAPCNNTPALTDVELRKEYMGCQNLPTALWHNSRRRPGEK
ncbi:hypothetical protein Z043_110190 [Scleropages formosus]|uniref:Uncharacterized protein n=1 Tax=Scleropages formosus TaxID=113540 RepID=A0A0N8K024_SCLFO|nr:hypothetical protein Z043_110190 [Scleropages formosus]